MGVHVGETWYQIAAAAIYDSGPARNAKVSLKAYVGDAPVARDDGPVTQHPLAGHGHHGDVSDDQIPGRQRTARGELLGREGRGLRLTREQASNAGEVEEAHG
jgi:hypothetical protein